MAKPDSLKKPLKLVFPIDPKMERAHPNLPQYASGDPSFRVDLTCDKAKVSSASPAPGVGGMTILPHFGYVEGDLFG